MTLGTSNTALAERYDAIPYAAIPHPQTHPDRLATVAAFMGVDAQPVRQSSVLEVGCSDGANLIPMALGLPSARFVGCDLSASALAAGRRTIEALGLTNIELVEEDLSRLAPEHGSFDYIIAHGVYSWVPLEVRDALFALTAKRLAKDGIMFVSFNTLPGCRVRQAVWETLHFHTDWITDPRARLAAARNLARIIGEGGKTIHEADEVVRAEFRAVAQRPDSALFHDDLAVPNDPLYFHEFVAHAGRHGLRYLAEAELHTMSAAGISSDVRSFLSTLDPASREQYVDFIRLRRFRQSLLCRREAATDTTKLAARITAMHVSADPSLLRATEAGRVADLARGLDPAHGGGGPVRVLLEMLVQRTPGSFSVVELREKLQDLPKPLEAILTEGYVASVVNLHVAPPTLATSAGACPLASPLARLQAQGDGDLTSLTHTRVRLPDANARRLLTLLDGTRERVPLAMAMSGSAFDFRLERANEFVTHALEQFARLGLLLA